MDNGQPMTELFSKDQLEDGKRLFTQTCELAAVAADPKQFPLTRLAEVALVGRSNVGKSTLINALVGRKRLARASKTPGRTQQIIFFNLANRLMLADLPGYGHAEAPRADKNKWNELVQHYLQTRPLLRCVCLLIDSRHGLLANDLTMMQFLDRAAVSYQVVLTKSDQLKPVEREPRQRQVTAMLNKHPAARAEALMCSAEKGTGLDGLRALLAEFTKNR